MAVRPLVPRRHGFLSELSVNLRAENAGSNIAKRN
jgi:hypothetical protein